MKKLYLIKNPKLFQGEKYLKKNKNYFEGWYFKNTNKKEGISFIPGINITKKDKKAFIQIITNKESYYIDYDISEFEFSHHPFYIKIGNNFFSEAEIIIDINDVNKGLIVKGNIKYSNSTNIATNNLNPNIMGPFTYLSFMECNHAIISMKVSATGIININDYKMIFKNDLGYIEKDFGISFPKQYIWIQGNNFKDKNVSFMLSIANIPFKIFRFKGLICSLIIGNEEYRFATYNGAKIAKYAPNNDHVEIILENMGYCLEIKCEYPKGKKLVAPVKGEMDKNIFESINAIVSVSLKKDKEIVFSDISKNCGLEIVKN